MNSLNFRRPRTALLWTLATVIIVADQLSKAWFVYSLGSAHTRMTFGSFLPRYLGQLKTGAEPDSIVYNSYGPFYHDQHVLGEWIRFHLTTNTGAAWSIFAGNSFVLSFVSLAIAGLLWLVWRRNFYYHRAMSIAIGAIIGGALGNSLDRFRLREVVDFVAVRIPYIGRLIPKLGDPYDFPIFNVADASAVCGTIALAGYLLWLDLSAGRRKRKLEEEKKGAAGFQPFAGGLQLDDEALERLRNIDTKSVPPWEPNMNQLAEEQEEVSAQRADQALRTELAQQEPSLLADYEPTASAVQLSRAEAALAPEAAPANDAAVPADLELGALLPDPRVDLPPAKVTVHIPADAKTARDDDAGQ